MFRDAAQDTLQVAVGAALLEDQVALHVQRGQFGGADLEAGEGLAGQEVGLVGHAGVQPALHHAAQIARTADDIGEQGLARHRDRGARGGRGLFRREGDIRVRQEQGESQGDAAGHESLLRQPQLFCRITDSTLNRLTPDP
jgi:hypothetical protein